MSYLFRREDDGEVVEVDFEQMMWQDRAGYITLPDGCQAKRCLHLELERDGRRVASRPIETGTPRTIVSDSLGFGEHQLADFEQDRQQSGFLGVEFVRDPQVPQFFQVKCSSRAEYERYVKHRGMVNKTGIGGVRLTQEDLDRAADLATRNIPPR